ncbi:MAG: hypothetical protein DMF54_07905 [Acidobacteria bacterium]|nr:MAG: hypothetical protein DMF54_07905 [Acidobacteriota bacterium]
MKTARLVSILFAVLLASAAAVPAAPGTNPAWEKMKSLVGQWEGTMSHGDMNMPVRVSYEIVSGGTSLMERLTAPDPSHEMITMYYPDGSRVMMTHYCSEGNQPRMRAEAASGDSVAFNFVDATNVASPEAEHMRKLVVKFQDADHFTQEWTHRKAGKEETGVFRYTRKK